MSVGSSRARVASGELARTVAERVAKGERFAGLLASAERDGATTLRALLAGGASIVVLESGLPAGDTTYPALTPMVPSAAWYEREIHDLFGLEPVGHPRLDPLVLPLSGDRPLRPRPGSQLPIEAVDLDLSPLPAHVFGEGIFTIPYGPVRSGVFESIEYLVESYGEDIPHLRTRIYHKHRGIERRFGDLGLDDAVLLAERVEGTSSVAHATAFAGALESQSDKEVPRAAGLVRVVHAELERVVNHLDSVIRHTEGAGQAVAYPRMTLHKERLMRLRARLCGHRFGRSVVVPGGVSGPPLLAPAAALSELAPIEAAIASDAKALMTTPSFLDRLRGTGVLPPELVAAHGAVGPVGRGSGVSNDVRADRPYGAYGQLGFEPAEELLEGDALARQLVRLEEVETAFLLVRRALEALGETPSPHAWHVELPAPSGLSIGSVEAPQGELIYVVEALDGNLVHMKPRTPSFHNLALLPKAFRGDILTDFVFIEASFGLSIAGAAG